MKLYSIMSCHAFKGSILTVSLLLKTIQGIYFVKKEISFVWSNKVLKKEKKKETWYNFKRFGNFQSKAKSYSHHIYYFLYWEFGYIYIYR